MDNKIVDIHIYYKDGTTYTVRALKENEMHCFLSLLYTTLSKISVNIIDKIIIN